MNPASPAAVMNQTIDEYWSVEGSSLFNVVTGMSQESGRRSGTWVLVSWTHSVVMRGSNDERHFIVVRFNRPLPLRPTPLSLPAALLAGPQTTMTTPAPLTESQLNTLLRLSFAANFGLRGAALREDIVALERLGLIARAAPGPGVTPSGWRITEKAAALMKAAEP